MKIIKKRPVSFKNRFVLAFLGILLSANFIVFARPIKIMPLGDSITSSLEYSASYRYFLWQMLMSAGFDSTQVSFVGSLCGTAEPDPTTHCVPAATTLWATDETLGGGP